MSHFSVLVIGDNVDKQLQPYHEYECTGIKDQYVVQVDETDENQKEFNEGTTEVVVMEDGKYVPKYDDRFALPRDPKDFFARQEYDYGGREVREVPLKEVYKTFQKFMEKWHGVDVDDHPEIQEGCYFRLTNPNKKWDWWQIGGRWTGFFRVKNGAAGNLGTPGIQRMNKNYEDPNALTHADQLRKRDIDLEAMRRDAQADAEQIYDRFEAATKGLEPAPLWAEVRDRHGEGNVEAAREEYSAIPWVQALRQARLDSLWDDPREMYCVDTGGREAFIQRKINHVGTTFALVKDSKWYQSGEMGWWGIVMDEKDTGAWEREFRKLLDEVPDDTLLTVVDCHI